jgi:hypothetical protein
MKTAIGFLCAIALIFCACKETSINSGVEEFTKKDSISRILMQHAWTVDFSALPKPGPQQIQFYPDNTIEAIVLPDMARAGNWQMNDDGDQIIFALEGRKTDTLNITILNDSVLIMNPTNGTQRWEYRQLDEMSWGGIYTNAKPTIVPTTMDADKNILFFCGTREFGISADRGISWIIQDLPAPIVGYARHATVKDKELWFIEQNNGMHYASDINKTFIGFKTVQDIMPLALTTNNEFVIVGGKKADTNYILLYTRQQFRDMAANPGYDNAKKIMLAGQGEIIHLSIAENSQIICATMKSGDIIASFDKGNTWNKLMNAPANTTQTAISGSMIVAAALTNNQQSGLCFISTDKGSTWVQSTQTNRISDICIADNDIYLSARLLRSQNKGNSWNSLVLADLMLKAPICLAADDKYIYTGGDSDGQYMYRRRR